MVNFETMTKEEAIKYCEKHEQDFHDKNCKNGESLTRSEKWYSDIIEWLRYDRISPKELPGWGMSFEKE
jgi:hypothetical protein